jgi:hypothetical protein
MAKQMSEAAQVAKEIRAILKANGVSGNVRSSNYSGGNSVSVCFAADICPEDYDKIYWEADKFRAGRFNSMEDIYEYRHTGGPSVDYIFFRSAEGYSMGYPEPQDA